MVIVKKNKVVQKTAKPAEMKKKVVKKTEEPLPKEEEIRTIFIDGSDFTDEEEEAMEVEEKKGKGAAAAVASGSDSELEEDDEDFGIDEEDVEGEDLDFDDEEEDALDEEDDLDEEGEEDDEEEEEEKMETGKKHKKDLLKLKETDPEFFKFMQEQDADLLEFQESDAEEGDEEQDEEEQEDEEEEEAEGGKSRAPKARKDGSGRLIFDGNMYDYLESILEPEDETKLKRKPEVHEVVFVVDAFQACVARVGADIDPPRYIINEQAVFESTVRICFQNLGDLFKRLIKYQLENVDSEHKGKQHRSRQFKKFQPHIKQYLTGVLLFLNEVQTDAVIVSTLKTIHRMLELYANVAKIARNLIKALVRIWTRKTLNCRIVAYMCLNELLKTHPEFLSAIYKSCYLGFVSNSREVSTETWPLLQFMHRTFAELTLIVPESAYPYAFVYIRQTAIHLRNAIIAKKRKDLVATIYNWQMIQCLYLWVRVVSKAHSVNGAETICELAYPLTQIIIGVMQLYPSPRYLPLRFHCISLLIQLQASCTTYIPVLNLGTELLHELSTIFEKRPSPSGSTKAGDLDCFIKVTTQTLDDPAWRVAACEHLFKLLIQAGHIMCSQPAFPDMVRPALHKIRAFCKSARGDHARLFRGLQDKLNEQAKFISAQLQLKEVDLGDEMNVRAVKFALNSPDSPLRAYYRQWEKVWKMKQEVAAKASDSDKKKAAKDATKNGKKVDVKEEEEDEDVKPVIEKKQKKKKRVTTPAAKTSDPTLPDTVADLGDWSD